MNNAYLSLGSNLGDRNAYLLYALNALDGHSKVAVVKTSPFFETAPIGYVQQAAFLNAAVQITTSMTPESLLALCQDIENQLLRQRAVRWGPRTIDIDILLYDDQLIDDPKLTIPHPEMLQRAFVLIPLQAIAPDLVLSGEPIRTHIARLEDQQVALFSGHAW